ncbi:MAG TPA: fucose isomerase [Clostridiales bacterium]|nr:fucose isomerase [Clostridiales bacterium]
MARCISPELIAQMMKLGHGDEIAFVDADFPAYACGSSIIRADGIDMLTMLKGILPLLPLDTYCDKPAVMMDVAGNQPKPDVWAAYADRIAEYHKPFQEFEFIERYTFYERAKKCRSIVITGETDGNIILRKGTVADQ